MLVLGKDAKARIGVDGSTPELYLSGSTGTDSGANGATIHLRGKDAVIRAGGNGKDGRMLVLGSDTKARIGIEGGTPYLGEDSTPELYLSGSGGTDNGAKGARIHLRGADAVIRAGGDGVPGRMLVLGSDGKPRITLEGLYGDIVLANGDCAEEFDVVDEASADPGTVMVMQDDGRLVQSLMPYDKRVAGVVAGAAGHRPGIILGKQETQSHRLPIGLLGRVSCKVDADYAPIAVGDLLTTSATPGHAMKANDPSQAFGAVLGKAMAPLANGRGLLPILITLQ
jgi:hypothetical protein